MVILPGRRNRFSGNDAYTKLLLHFDGADEATATVDSSGSGHAVTFNGTAQLDTAQKVFGPSSLLLDGNSDYLSIADSDDFAFGTDNFTIDFRVRFAALPSAGGNQVILHQPGNPNTNWQIYLNNTGGTYYIIAVFINSNSFVGRYYLSFAAEADTWYHIALVRDGAAGYLFNNGSMVGMTEATAFGVSDTGNSASDLYIGKALGALGMGSYLNGWIDELRVSKGIARWTTSFTPSGPYR